VKQIPTHEISDQKGRENSVLKVFKGIRLVGEGILDSSLYKIMSKIFYFSNY
jgi:hypothetical protein